MDWQDVIGTVSHIEVIAEEPGIREIARLRRRYGIGRWKKKKGVAHIRLLDGEILLAEIHWYEAHGVGKYEPKIKHPLPSR